MQSPEPTANQLSSSITFAHVVYLLQALGFVSGITAIVGVIISYIKLGDLPESWIETHFRWQIKTFWVFFIVSVIGILLSIIIIGYFILVVVWIWAIYRIIKGWLRLSENRPVI